MWWTKPSLYNDFVNIVKWHINSIVPVRIMSMRERDPSYITLRIKIWLRKRNKLRRAGQMEQADYIAVKINRLMAHNRRTALAGASNTDTKQLWGLLKRTGNWERISKQFPTLTQIRSRTTLPI